MSKSSKQIAINFPNELLEDFEKCLNPKFFRDFVREAVAEKLRRDYGLDIPKTAATRKAGERVDLRDCSPEKRKKMCDQAARAREAKLRKRA